MFSDCCSATAVPCTLYQQTAVCTVDLRTCNCFEIAPSDFPDLFKSIMCSFRPMLSFVDFSNPVFLAESNGCIKQVLLKWAQNSHQLLSTRITQKRLRGHDTKNIWFTQHSVITKIDRSSYCMYIFDPADLVTFQKTLVITSRASCCVEPS